MRGLEEVTVVAITNDGSLGEAIGRTVKYWLRSRADFFRLTYGQCSAQLTAELIATADLFVLDLLRSYPGGIRAEGIALGERLADKGKLVLIVAPLTLAQDLRCQCYWDVGDPRSLGSRLQEILNERRNPRAELTQLRRFFNHLITIPSQHD